MATRREARRIAIDIVYQADITGEAAPEVAAGWRAAEREVPEFSQELAEGVAERQPEIDLLLETHSEGWSVARMAALDRSILRVAVYELLWREDVPSAVAISEAVEAANELSTDDSGRFVNGVLGKIARDAAEPA